MEMPWSELESYAQMIGPIHADGSVPDRSPELLSMLWTTTVLALITAILRFCVRKNYGQFGWDDTMMLATMVRPSSERIPGTHY